MKPTTKSLQRSVILALLAVLVTAGSVWFSERPTEKQALNSPPNGTNAAMPPPAGPVSGQTPSRTPPAATDSEAVAVYQTPAQLPGAPLAPSLAGTDIDGALRARADGSLILDLGTRDFFDYFFNAVGEVSPDAVLEQIQALAAEHLPPAAREEAMALLDQYLEYKQRALTLNNQALDPTRRFDPGYQLQVLESAAASLRQLREQVFSPQAHAAFFAMEEAYADYTLAALTIQQRDDLSISAKQQLLAWHRDQLPAEIRRTESRLRQQEVITEGRLQGIDNADSPAAAGRALEEQGVSPEAAAEVVRYLEDRASFEASYEQYQAAAATLTSAGLSEADKSAHQQALLEQYFPAPKLRTWARLKSLEHPAGANPL